MMRRALFAAAAACACLLASPASAGTLDTYPIVTPASSDKLCGYANATGHPTQCATAQTDRQPRPTHTPRRLNRPDPVGQRLASSPGPNTLTYCPTCNGGGPLLSLTTPVSITNQTFTFVNNSAVSWLQATPSSSGGILGLTTGSLIEWANTVGFLRMTQGEFPRL